MPWPAVWLERRWRAPVEGELGVDVVLDQRDAVPLEHGRKRRFAIVVHRAAGGIGEAGHQHGRAHAVAAARRIEPLGVDSVLGVARQLEHVGAHALDSVENAEIGGALDGDAIARARHATDRERERFHGAVGDEDVLCGHREAPGREAPCDEAAQLGVARGQ